MKADTLLERIVDGRTDLVWDHIAQGHPATARAADGRPLVQWCAYYGENGDSPLSWASWYARPDSILRRLCYGTFTIHPDRMPMQAAILGRPRGQR